MRTWTIREATEADAENMVRYALDLFNEPGLDLPIAPGEFHLSVNEERAVVARHRDQINAVFLLAFDQDGKIVGMLNCHGSTRRALQHSCELSISTAQPYRGQGVGTALLSAAVDWARGTRTVKRIELHVYERNVTAIRLYHRFGFEVEGRRRRAIYQDGQYLDDLAMVLLL